MNLRDAFIGSILIFAVPQAMAVTSHPAPSLKDKKFCLFEVLVDYDGQRDILVSRYRCDGLEEVILESQKLEKDEIIKTEVPRQATLYGKHFLEEGFKIANCNSFSPVVSMRYYNRYACTFVRLNP